MGDVDALNADLHAQDRVNRRHQQTEAAMLQTQVFDAGLAFLEHNHARDHWLPQIETLTRTTLCGSRGHRALYPSRPGAAPRACDRKRYRRYCRLAALPPRTKTPRGCEARQNHAALVSL